MNIDSALVRELAELLADTGLTEIEVEDGDRKIRVKRELTMAAAPVQHIVAAPPAATHASAAAATGAAESAAQREPAVDDQEDDLSPIAQPKRKHWYTRRKSRRLSDGDVAPEQTDEQSPGRSFVVVRKQRPGMPQKHSGGSADLSSEQNNAATSQ